MVAGVEKASCWNASTLSVWQPAPEVTSGKPYAHLLRLPACGDQGFASLLISTATTRELALDDLLLAMLAPLVLSSQELLIKTLTSSHLAWFMVSDISSIKDSRVVESSNWSECLVRMPKKLERAVNRGIGSVLWLSALVHGMAANALENRSCVTGCIWDLLGSRNIFVAGRRWGLKGLKFSYVEVLQLEVVVAHSLVVWTLPGSKIVIRALGKVRRWVGKCSGDFTQLYRFHVIVDQIKILRSLRGGEGPSPLFRTLCHGFVDKRFVVSDIEGVAKQFVRHSPHASMVWWLVGMGIGIVLLQWLTLALGVFAEEVLMQLVVLNLKAVQDKRLLHLHKEVVTFEAIEDFKVMGLVYVVNTVSGVVHGPVEWAEDACLMRWRTYCGWTLGLSHYEVSLVVPVGAVMPGCLGKGTKCLNFYAVRLIQKFLLTGFTAKLRVAIESA